MHLWTNEATLLKFFGVSSLAKELFGRPLGGFLKASRKLLAARERLLKVFVKALECVLQASWKLLIAVERLLASS